MADTLNPFVTPGAEEPVQEFEGATEEIEVGLNPFVNTGDDSSDIAVEKTTMSPTVDTSSLFTYDENDNLVETRVIDGDTLEIGGVSHRAISGNTSEAPKFIEGTGVFNPGGVLGTQQTELVRDAIAAGRVRVIPTGEQDVYGRELSKFEFVDTGEDVYDWMISEGLADINVDGLRYSTGKDKARALRRLSEQTTARSGEELRDTVNFFQDNLTAETALRGKFDYLLASNYTGPLELASNKEEYERMEFYRSYKGQQEFTDKINELQRALADEPDNVELQEELKATREIAQQWALAPQTYYGYNGSAYVANKGYFGQTMDSIDAGVQGLQLMANNLTIWSGDLIESVGIETSLDELGEEWADENLRELMEASRHRVTWEDVRGLDASVGTYFQFASNMIFEFGPQLALLVGASSVNPTLGLATAYGMAVGEVHGAFESSERNPYLSAAVAIPVALLDRMVPGQVTNPQAANMLTAEGRDYVYKTIMDAKGVSYEGAKKIFNEQSKELMEEMVVSIDDLVTQNMIAKKGMKDFLWDCSTDKWIGILNRRSPRILSDCSSRYPGWH